jgi:transcriptional regulator with AAA-type ATPase domain
VERHPGLLTAAHGGTVFLDEVGDLAPEAPVMLLRFLAEGEIRPVSPSRVDTVIVNQYRCVLAKSERATLGKHWASLARFCTGK